MTHYNRGAWRARQPNARYDLDPRKVTGVVLHWPAIGAPLRTVDAVMAGLRGWQNYHMDAKQWSDIAYQIAIDQAGNSYVLRGHKHRSGANGDEKVNERYGAFLLVLAPGEKPSRPLIDTTRRQIARHRLIFPKSHQILGHSDVRPEPTSCPGPLVLQAIKAGTFNPQENQ